MKLKIYIFLCCEYSMKLNENSVRRVLSVLFALLVALVLEHYFSHSHDYLMPLAAVFVMLTSVGNLIYQGILRFILLMIFVIILSWLFPPLALLNARIYDVCIGSLLGIIVNLMVLPRHADAEFRNAILPIFEAYKDYFSEMMNSIFEKNENAMEAKQIALEKSLKKLPSWVYAQGFDLGLKRGHQYFSMKIHHIAEILFAMHHHARFRFDRELLTDMREDVLECANKITGFLAALITVFELKKLKEGVEDFEHELTDLDRKFQSLLPVNAELLDMSSEDSHFYAIIYGMQDLRKALLKLGQALR
jgi:hypothetical protein